MRIRSETPADADAIADVIGKALSLLLQATGTEAAIVDRLRAANALDLSLVAEEDGMVLGYLAASHARIGAEPGWSVIGPLVVQPARHGQGIGRALMTTALERLRSTHRGAALVGDPGYYHRFGFRTFPGLVVTGCPPEVVQALPFDGLPPKGEVIHHPAFGLNQPG